MVATYSVFGRQVGSHYLSMATLGVTFTVPFLLTRGGGSTEAKTTPPLNAGSQDEEKFIKEFMQSIEQEEGKAKK